ncbi:hypothetical protein HMI48_05085 [Acidithiobacillus ferrooxidans]|uniref:hypothetical protein n=1 Tax=Acidithiobacillus ferrooxidans TaxID=920 RepID=UPI001C07B255|nr:hypothetical protein [Acidithiobacillus ferrooxidans]MBU2773299.1 hypothetical protein [Acidithiobacillus ferrooxidans]
MQILHSAQDIAGIIKRHPLTSPTWLIAEGGYGAETTADQLERLGITTRIQGSRKKHCGTKGWKVLDLRDTG